MGGNSPSHHEPEAGEPGGVTFVQGIRVSGVCVGVGVCVWWWGGGAVSVI